MGSPASIFVCKISLHETPHYIVTYKSEKQEHNTN